MRRSSTLVLASLVLSIVSSWDINNATDRAACQAPTPDLLDGCDRTNTLLVTQAGGNGTFKTVQSAILSLPNNTSPYTILITPGTYKEQINITRTGPTYLLGSTSSPLNSTLNSVAITWAAIAGSTLDNAFTSTLTIAPTLESSLTGSGPSGYPVPANTPFGCTDFRAYNLNVINNYAEYSDTPSLAVSVDYANAGFYHSSIESYQDTIYVGKLGSMYTSHTFIAGETDFLYGFGTGFIYKSTLLLRGCGGGITAWKGTNTSFVNKYGVYISNSVIKAANSSVAESIKRKCALGRPWNSAMRAVIGKTWLDESILDTGYVDWIPSRYVGNVTLQAEFENLGPGWNETARKEGRFERLLSASEWEEYNQPKKVFQFRNGTLGNDKWVDYDV